MALYQLLDPAHARQRAQTLIADLRGCPIPKRFFALNLGVR